MKIKRNPGLEFLRKSFFSSECLSWEPSATSLHRAGETLAERKEMSQRNLHLLALLQRSITCTQLARSITAARLSLLCDRIATDWLLKDTHMYTHFFQHSLLRQKKKVLETKETFEIKSRQITRTERLSGSTSTHTEHTHTHTHTLVYYISDSDQSSTADVRISSSQHRASYFLSRSLRWYILVDSVLLRALSKQSDILTSRESWIF